MLDPSATGDVAPRHRPDGLRPAGDVHDALSRLSGVLDLTAATLSAVAAQRATAAAAADRPAAGTRHRGAAVPVGRCRRCAVLCRSDRHGVCSSCARTESIIRRVG